MRPHPGAPNGEEPGPVEETKGLDPGPLWGQTPGGEDGEADILQGQLGRSQGTGEGASWFPHIPWTTSRRGHPAVGPLRAPLSLPGARTTCSVAATPSVSTATGVLTASDVVLSAPPGGCLRQSVRAERRLPPISYLANSVSRTQASSLHCLLSHCLLQDSFIRHRNPCTCQIQPRL